MTWSFEAVAMPLDYLPILAERAAPEPPRKLRRSPKVAWQPLARPLNEMRVSLVTSAAIRQSSQRPFPTLGDAGHRRITADPDGAELCIDHRSPVGTDARRDPEVVLPRRALTRLAQKGAIARVASGHFSIYGGITDHRGVTDQLAPTLARKLAAMRVDLAVMVPY